MRSTRDLAGRDVDRDLRDLAAERVHAHAVGIRAARARADELRLAELARDLDDRLAQRAVERDERAVDDLEVVGRDLEHVARELEQLAAQVVGRRAHRGRDRRHRLRAARDGRVDAVARGADLDAHAVERQAELLGGDLRERRRHAGADVLRARDDRDHAVVAHAHERVRRRAAAAPPDLTGGAQAALAAVGVLALAQRVALRPAGQLGGAVDAGLEVLGRVRQAADLVDIDVVGAPQVERVERERRGELVERALVAERALHDPRGAERVRRLDVDQQRDRLRAHVGAAVERARRRRRRDRSSRASG